MIDTELKNICNYIEKSQWEKRHPSDKRQDETVNSEEVEKDVQHRT